MLGREFSIILAVILGALTVAFLMGKGNFVLDLFQSKNAPAQKKRSPEDELKYQRAIGIFCLVLCINETINAFVANGSPIFGIITIVVVVLDMAFLIWYLRKNSLN